MAIKILTGYSNPGGSTFAHINLCNLFNEKGEDCTLYGPHDWHLDKCKSGRLNETKLSKDDILIYHFLNIWNKRPPVKKLVLSLHEKELYKLKEKPIQIFDKIHYLNLKQFDWHGGYECGVDQMFICPNAHSEIEPSKALDEKVVGIIGNIDRNKQVHRSIQRAIVDGHTDIRIFGSINDVKYWVEECQHLLSDKVRHMGFVEDRQSIYDQITDVYHSSISENASLVVDECNMAGVKMHGNEQTDIGQPLISNNDVYDIWRKELGL